MDVRRRRLRHRAGVARWFVPPALAVLALATWFALPDTLGTQVRRQVVAALEEAFPDHHVHVGRVRVEPGLGVVIADVRIATRHARDRRPLARIDRVICETRVNLEDATRGWIDASRVVVNGLELTAWPEADGRWPLAELLPLPEFGSGCPEVIVTGARLRIASGVGRDAATVELRDVGGRVRSDPSDPEGGRVFRFRGTGDAVRDFAVSGSVLPGGRWRASGRIEGARLDSDLFARLPEGLLARARPLVHAACVAGLRFQLAGCGTSADAFAARVQIHEGRFADPELPTPVERIRGVFVCRPAGVEIESLQAEFGGALVRGSGRIGGWDASAPIELAVGADDLSLSDRLAAALPPNLRELWDRGRPAGRIDVESTVRGDFQHPEFDATVRLEGVDITFDRFPYPVRSLVGTVRYADRRASAEGLVGEAGGQRLRCGFQFSHGPVPADEWIELALDGPLPIDESLLAALSPRSEPSTDLERFTRSLNPAGTLHLIRGRFGRTAAGELIRTADLSVLAGRIRYRRFPYPVEDISGRILLRGETAQLVDFQGQNYDTARIACEGTWTSDPDHGGHLALRFDGYSMPLDDTLRFALSPELRQTWDVLGPGGVLDHLHVDVGLSKGGPPELEIVAEQWSADGIAPRAVTIEPAAMPYRLEIVKGSVRLHDDEVEIADIDATHGPTRLTGRGRCARRGDGRWALGLEIRPGSRLHADRDLLASLPAEVRGTFDQIDLQGPLGVHGNTELLLPSREAPHPEFHWDLSLQLEGNRIGRDAPVNNIRGEVLVAGRRSQGESEAEGHVRIDSVMVHAIQLTQLRGPFAIRDGRLAIGRAAGASDDSPDGEAASSSRAGRPITARVFDGDAEIDGTLSFNDGRYDVTAKIEDGDVSATLFELGQSASDVSGRCGGAIRVDGLLGLSQSISGTGRAHLRDANLYQLPQIVQLLDVLRVTPSERAAFTTGDVRFRIDGDLVMLDQLRLWGDLIALHGGGTVTRRGELNLALDTRVSPHSPWHQLVRPLQGQQYNLWSVEVSGSVDDPVLKKRALPQVEQALERLLPEKEGRLQRPRAAGNLLRLPGRW